MNRAMMEADRGCGCEGSIPAPHAVNRTMADEVERDIRQRRRKESREQQPALGEMILEDFLVNAEVGAEDSCIAFMPREHWLQHRHCDHHHQQLQASALASDNPATSDPQTPGRKRAAGGEVSEKTTERRHKRLIKNRESAARSRARKQVGHSTSPPWSHLQRRQGVGFLFSVLRLLHSLHRLT